MQESQTAQSNTGLIYGLNDRPPVREAIFAAIQHLLAIFVAIITPPLIIAGALKLDLETTSFLVSMSLFASGISTFIQCRRIGGIGTGLLCIQGTSFSFIGPIISAGMLGGLPLIFGTCIVASSVEMVISRILKYTRKIITPLVSGIVVTLIGMSLIKVGITACGGGVSAQSNGTFGSFENLGLALLVLILIILFNRSSNRYLRMSSIVIGLIIGYLVAWGLGRIDFSAVQSFGGFNIPLPFKYGLDFDFSAFIALGLVFLITAIEAYGDITANSLISGEPVEGKTFIKRASGGILADGFNSMMAGILNSFPNSVFAQNNGMIQLTGVASRYVGYYIAGFLILLGLFPSVGLIFSLMPEPVSIAVGAMTILTSVMQFAMLPLQGVAQGAQPILSYNFGAKNADRVKKTFFRLLTVSLCYSVALWAFVMLFPKTFAGIFSPNPELVNFTGDALRIYCGALFLFGIQIACQMTFVSVGNAGCSIIVAVLRKFVLLIPLIYIMPQLLADKTNAVYTAEPAADAIAVTCTAILFSIEFRKALKKLNADSAGAAQTAKTDLRV